MQWTIGSGLVSGCSSYRFLINLQLVPWSALDFYVKVAGKKATDEVWQNFIWLAEMQIVWKLSKASMWLTLYPNQDKRLNNRNYNLVYWGYQYVKKKLLSGLLLFSLGITPVMLCLPMDATLLQNSLMKTIVVVLTYVPGFVASTQKGDLLCHRDQSCKSMFFLFFPKATFCQSLDKILILSSFLFATMLHGQLERSQFS